MTLIKSAGTVFSNCRELSLKNTAEKFSWEAETGAPVVIFSFED